MDLARRRAARTFAAVSVLLAAHLLLQLHFLRTYPQPMFFGDPVWFRETGLRMLDAWHRWRAGESLATAFDSIRGVLLLAGVGGVFAAMEAVRPGDFQFFRAVFAVFNTLALLAAFLIGRRLAGRGLGGYLAIALGLAHPALSIHVGRLYPDPVTACLLAWSAWLYLEGVIRGRRRWLVGAGLVLTAALFVRSQLALYMLVVTPAAFAASAWWWARTRDGRRLALAAALSLLPLAVGWVVIEKAVGSRDDVTRFGNLTFRPPYPYGFWQFLDADGWSSAYRFKSEPYYLALVEENARNPGLWPSKGRQLAFTARWVLARPWDSVGIVVNNVYRLLDRPANDYKWDYPVPYGAQVVLQRLIAVAALVGLAMFAAERLATLGVFFVPLALVALHGLMFVWPRYNVPMMPILIAAAGAAIARLATDPAARARLGERRFLTLASGGVLALALGFGLFDPAPALARLLRLAGLLAVLALPFVLAREAAGRTRTARRWTLTAWAALAVVVGVNEARDRLWHERHVTVGPHVRAVEQVITVDAAAVGELRQAREAFVALDLAIPGGDTSKLSVEVNGRRYEGRALVPTMPHLPESTSTGGRDASGYPQWWMLPLDPALLPAGGGTVTVRLTAEPGASAKLGLDRFAAQQQVYEGPSFGERPHMVALKLEYDADYRLPIRYALGSAGTRTRVTIGEDPPRDAAGVARIRLVTLANDEGRIAWRTDPAPASPAAFGFFAYTGERDEATLRVDGQPVVRLPLGNRRSWTVEGGGWTLCRRGLGLRGERPYGAFVLSGPATVGKAHEIQVDFTTGPSDVPMLFIVDARRALVDLGEAFDACSAPPARVRGVAEVLDATRNAYPDDTGRWTVGRVY